MSVKVRAATADDAAAIAHAHVRGWQVGYDGLVDAAYLAAIDIGERTESWRTNLEATTLSNGWPAPTDLVAEVHGRVVGFVNIGLWRGTPQDSSAAEIWALYVHPDHWGTGAGYALMNAALAWLESGEMGEIATLYLWVLEDNHRARRFYERQGWVADSVVEDSEIAGETLVSRRYSRVL